MLVHVGLELGADAKAVVNDNRAQVVDASVEALQPRRRALQPVRRTDIEHQEPIAVADQRFGVEIAREQLRMPRLEAAVAADVEVPALLGRDDPEVLALRLRALTRAPRNCALELVRSTQPAISQLQ